MLALLVLLFFPLDRLATTSALSGDWTTDDSSVVRVYPCEAGHLCARIVTVRPKDKNSTDGNNPDASLRTRPVCGITIGTGFLPDGATQAKNGKLYDPDSGKTYAAQMQTDGNTLKLRGYIGISLLGRTETWHRASNTAASCS